MRLNRDCQVLVTGAGPVGLFAALSMAERGIDVQVIDKEWRGSSHSYALALHPAALRLLDRLGVAEELVRKGRRVERMAFYRGDDPVGALNLTEQDEKFPFLLVAPQSALEQALEAQLKKRKVRLLWNHQLQSLESVADGVEIKVALMEKYSTGYPVTHTEWMVAKEIDVRSAFVLGADGYHSRVRKAINSRYEHLGQAETFSVFEFPCPVEIEPEARAVLRDDSLNVLWPLDGQRARWSFQVDPASPPEASLKTLNGFIRERAPWFGAKIEEIYWHTTVMFERRLADPFGSGRVLLAGDSGHITGPVGAQSMNVGMREADDLAKIFASVLQKGQGLEMLERYQDERTAEWRQLLSPGKSLRARDGAPEWARRNADRLLPCVPASGEELRQLLVQVGLELD
jgi:2-polyprenyl-6-methoxyphenol hydroxylase-like FAD-dependent oxidoreductase